MAVKAPEKVEEEVIFIPALKPMEIDPRSREILEKAYEDLKRPWGWMKGNYESYKWTKGERVLTHCTIGAINVAAGSNDAYSGNSAAMKAAKYFAKVIGQDIIPWNDAPKRRKHHVLRVFEELLKD